MTCDIFIVFISTQGRQSTSQSTVAIDGFGHSRSGTFTTTVSYTSGISGMMRQDSNASVDEEQSLSPSTGPSEGDLHDPNLFPPMNSSPKTPGRQSGGRAHTLPRMGMDDVSFSSKTTPGRDVLTLEDFLAEDDTPKTKVTIATTDKSQPSNFPKGIVV